MDMLIWRAMYDLAKSIVWGLFRVLSLEYRGTENVPSEGPAILAGNHPSYLDPILVGLPMKRRIHFMAWDALFKIPVFGQIIRALGAFPVDLTPGKGDAAYHEAVNVLNDKHVLGIFPEGQRSDSRLMGGLRTGVARLAIETGAPIIPATIGGATRVWPKWKLFPKPAKLIVTFHEPIILDERERIARRDDKGYRDEVMEKVAQSINSALLPALRGSEAWERWYRQPPSHIRTYEWAPLIAALIASFVLIWRGTFRSNWHLVWLPILIYFGYLIADLTLFSQGRMAKWIRNSMPIWLIGGWHTWLTRSLELPYGSLTPYLAVVTLAVFFVFFYEDYYSLQKYVRGIVVAYYLTLALELLLPHSSALLVTLVAFQIAFLIWFDIKFRWILAALLAALFMAAMWFGTRPSAELIVYACLGLVTVIYLETFISAAYDIRKTATLHAGPEGGSSHLVADAVK